MRRLAGHTHTHTYKQLSSTAPLSISAFLYNNCCTGICARMSCLLGKQDPSHPNNPVADDYIIRIFARIAMRG
jgi:hypothetical protein